MGISSKVNAIAQQEFELAYYTVTVQYVNHNAIGTSPLFTLRNYKGLDEHELWYYTGEKQEPISSSRAMGK